MAKKKSGLKPGQARVSKDTIEVNLAGIEARQRKAAHIPEGNYKAKIVSAETKKFSTGKKGVVTVFEIDEGKHKGARFWNNNVLLLEDDSPATDNLWAFRGLLQALTPEVKIPERSLKIPLDKLVGRTAVLEIVDGEYEGKIRSEINDIFHESLLDEDEEDEEDEDEDEDEDFDDEDEEEDDDEDEDEDEDEEDEDEEDEDEIDLDEDEL